MSLLTSQSIELWLGICCSHRSPEQDIMLAFFLVIGELLRLLQFCTGNRQKPHSRVGHLCGHPNQLLRFEYGHPVSIPGLLLPCCWCPPSLQTILYAEVQKQALPVMMRAKKTSCLSTAAHYLFFFSAHQHTPVFAELPFAGSGTCRIPPCV